MISQAKLLRRIRVGFYVILLLGGGYLWLRFEMVPIPEDAYSPLVEFDPGARLVVDTHFGELQVGDVVLFEGDPGEILFGRIEEPPPSAPREIWDAVEGGELWIEGDRPDVPVRDSRILGTIPRERVTGRVAFALDW